MVAEPLSFHQMVDQIKKLSKKNPSLVKKKSKRLEFNFLESAAGHVVSAEAIDAIAEYLNLFTRGMRIEVLKQDLFSVLELAMRAAIVANSHSSRFVEIEHIEKILAQLLLDFS